MRFAGLATVAVVWFAAGFLPSNHEVATLWTVTQGDSGWHLDAQAPLPLMDPEVFFAQGTLLHIENRLALPFQTGFRYSLPLSRRGANPIRTHPIWVYNRALIDFDGSVAEAHDPRLVEVQRSASAAGRSEIAALLPLGKGGQLRFSFFGLLYWVVVLAPIVFLIRSLTRSLKKLAPPSPTGFG